MKHMKPAAIVLILLLCALSGTFWGCDSGDGTPEVIDEESITVEMMKMIPGNLRNFVFVDVHEMRSDPELVIYLDEGEGPKAYLDAYVELLDVNQMAVVSHAEGLWIIPPIQIITGDFDLDSFRNLLGSEEYVENESEGIEIWDVALGDYAETVALMDNTIMIGYEDVIRDSIQVARGTKLSLYDDTNFREVLGKLPPGISVACNEGVFLGQYTYNGLLVSGLSAAKNNAGVMELTWVCKFATAEDARDSLGIIEVDVLSQEYFGFTNVTTTQEDQFVRVTAQTSIVTYFGEEVEEE